MCAIHKCRTKWINQRIRLSNTNLLMRWKQNPSEQKQITVGVWKDLHAQRWRQGICGTSQLAGCFWQLLSPGCFKSPWPTGYIMCTNWNSDTAESIDPMQAEWSWPWKHGWKQKGPDMIRVWGVSPLQLSENTWMSGTWVVTSDRYHCLR